MLRRDRLGLNVSPVFLRVALGIVFVWAGSSKLLHSDEFGGDRAARLATMGVISVKPPEGGVSPVVVPEEAAPAEEAEPKAEEPKPVVDPAPAAAPDSASPSPAPAPTTPETQSPSPAPVPGGVVFIPATARSLVPKKPTGEAAPPTKISIGTPTARIYSAEDFPHPVKLKRLYHLVLLMDTASRPNGNGHVLWPSFLASPKWIVRMAWAAALTEFIGGMLILLGLLTRPAAVGIFGTMLTAIWLTQIGPALGSPDAFLGFLPDPMMGDSAGWNSMKSGWMTILWQFSLASMALALVFSGAGRASMDALIFKRGDEPVKKFERPTAVPTKRPV